jgi:hypothetical protein
MVRHFASSKANRQAFLCWQEMDMRSAGFDDRGMVRKPPKRQPPPLFLGQWLLALGRKQSELARATGINEGYISQLISGEKKNPGTAVLGQIGDFLGIPQHYLHQPPPDRGFIEEVSRLDPDVLARLRRPQN